MFACLAYKTETTIARRYASAGGGQQRELDTPRCCYGQRFEKWFYVHGFHQELQQVDVTQELFVPAEGNGGLQKMRCLLPR